MDLLEGDALGHLATIRADGTPHVTPLWIDHDGDSLLVNVRVDRVKSANMRARPAVALSVVDPRNPYRYLAITGRVVSWSEDGRREHMDALSRRYLKVERYPWSFAGERRAIFRIELTHVYYEARDVEVAEA
jgi:PPOX class probable F420-dependent enzyme